MHRVRIRGSRQYEGATSAIGWFALVSFGAATIVGSRAAVPPTYMEQARRRAAMHVQIEKLDVTVPDSTPGDCRVRGRIARIFDDRTELLRKGQELTIGVSCKRLEDRVPPGGTLWTSTGALENARFLEAYLDFAADSHHPRIPVRNYSFSRQQISEPTIDPEYRDTHFTAVIREATHRKDSTFAEVHAEVDKIFRDRSGLLSPGRRLVFPLDCGGERHLDSERTSPCGEILRAKDGYVEVVFYLGIPFDQVGIIESLTSEPTCPRDASGYWCEGIE